MAYKKKKSHAGKDKSHSAKRNQKKIKPDRVDDWPDQDAIHAEAQATPQTPDPRPFKLMLPQAGFDWPVFARTLSPFRLQDHLAMDRRHVDIIVFAVRCANRLSSPKHHAKNLLKPANGGNAPRYLSADCLEADLARLFSFATSLLVANSEIDLGSYGWLPEKFWARVMRESPQKNPDKPWMDSWFSTKRPGASTTCKPLAVYDFVVLAISARLRGLEQRQRMTGNQQEKADGRLAVAVDGFIDVLRSSVYASNPEVRDAYFNVLDDCDITGMTAEGDEEKDANEVDFEIEEGELVEGVEGMTLEEDARAGFSDAMAEMVL